MEKIRSRVTKQWREWEWEIVEKKKKWSKWKMYYIPYVSPVEYNSHQTHKTNFYKHHNIKRNLQNFDCSIKYVNIFRVSFECNHQRHQWNDIPCVSCLCCIVRDVVRHTIFGLNRFLLCFIVMWRLFVAHIHTKGDCCCCYAIGYRHDKSVWSPPWFNFNWLLYASVIPFILLSIVFCVKVIGIGHVCLMRFTR